MGTEDERCAEARKFARIDDAFRRGDLDALRTALDDPAAVPNGRMPDSIGSCLVYAVYHSPLAFIRTLLEIGADPNAPADDGFPPLIAALSCTRDAPGANRRIGRRRHPPAAALVRRGSERTRRQRLHAAPHGGRGTESARDPHPARGGRRSRPAHTDRRMRNAARDGECSRIDRPCGDAYPQGPSDASAAALRAHAAR